MTGKQTLWAGAGGGRILQSSTATIAGQENGPGHEGTAPELASGGRTAPARLAPARSRPEHMRPQPSDTTKRPCRSSSGLRSPRTRQSHAQCGPRMQRTQLGPAVRGAHAARGEVT